MRKCLSVAFASVLFLSVSAPNARAQCPDGSAPPCRGAVQAAAPTRRVNPPLDDRTWIVVPFSNLARNQDVDWLRSASVNLLYLDMSRWRDIRVIDDERVADLMRETTEAASAPQLSLSTGLAVAKRAGARNLVMGDVLKVGTRTAVTAKVFDVRSGQRVRSVSEEASVQDSVMPLFGKLARKILDVAPPEGANLGAVGTSSIAAYQEYMQGVQALNAFSLTEARRRFEHALQLDSTFALAHYKLAIVSGWDDATDPGNKTHSEAAARLATKLPARERGLINGALLLSRQEYGKSCEAFQTLLHADSSDTDAWYGFGDCRYHDVVVEPTDGDTTRMRFRGSLNESINAFRRALELDPAYHLAYQHIVDGYLTQNRSGSHCVDGRCTQYSTMVMRSGDSLVMTPVRMPRDTALFREQRAEYVRTASRRRNVESALAVARQWVTANPDEDRAILAMGLAAFMAGRPAESDAQLNRLRGQIRGSSAFNAQLLRIEARAKLWGPDAVRLYDSLRASPMRLMFGLTPPTLGGFAALVAPVFGRMTEFDSVNATATRTPTMMRAQHAYMRVLMGVIPDGMEQLERAAFDETLASRSVSSATSSISATLAFALRMPRANWPAFDTTAKVPLLQPAKALVRGDTAGLRAAARMLDSLTVIYVASLTPDTGAAIVAADAYLILKDSAAALRMTRRFLDSLMVFTPLSPRLANFPYALLVPRAMLLRADLAAGLGQRDEARLWYQRFIDLWSTAVPELQPLVTRARKSYAAVGGT